jgi:roadblock/LC7 domain-containing protein
MRLDSVALAVGCALLLSPTAHAKPTKVSKKIKGNALSPLWSGDGSKFSYEVHIPAKDARRTYLAGADGKNPKAVVPDTGPSIAGFGDGKSPPVKELVWHTKGGYIYVSIGGAKSEFNVYMDGEGCLTCDHKVFGLGNKIHPTFSPDGKWLAYAKEQHDQGDIFLANIYELEKGATQITESDDETSYQPRFSPDGKRLLFTRFDPDKSDNNLYVLDDFRDKKTLRKLTKMAGAELNASWSPDGKWVAFFSNSRKKNDKDFDLWVVPADGSSAPKKLVTNVIKPDRANPVWTPDGARIFVVKQHRRRQDPIMWVSVTDPKQKGIIKTGTELNDYIAVHEKDGALILLWTAQSKRGDKKKTWRKVYQDTVTLP